LRVRRDLVERDGEFAGAVGEGAEVVKRPSLAASLTRDAACVISLSATIA
jgi:hypothetical protein